MKKLTQEEFINRAKKIHGNKYDYSKVVYLTNKVKVCIICPIHGAFWQTPNAHLLGQGCKQCYTDVVGDSLRTTKEEFIRKAKAIHGDKYDYSKVEYVNNKTEVIIICPIHGEFKQRPDMHTIKGNGCRLCRSDKLKRKLFGVAIFDGYQKRCDCYSHWYSMLMRCYSKQVQAKNIAYRGCSVCEEWLLYSNFKRWFENPENGYQDGYHLDKDILVKGNKIYSPQTCCFVPSEINSLLVNRRNFRGNNVIGVHQNKSGNYFSVCSLDNKSIRLGTFKTEEEAFNAYKSFKEKNIKRVADKYKNKVVPKVHQALYNYQVEIND